MPPEAPRCRSHPIRGVCGTFLLRPELLCIYWDCSAGGAGMADIFISYSKKHADLTEALARDLEAEGYTT